MENSIKRGISLIMGIIMLAVLMTLIPTVQASHNKILFTDATENAKWFNWLLFIYGVPHGILSEVAYFYNANDCFTGMLLLANGVLGMSVFANLHFIEWWDWIQYFLSLV